MQRMTIRKPGADGGYRLPLIRSNWKVECDKGQSDVYGEPVNRLGQFEDLGMEPDEIRRRLDMAERYEQLIKHWENEKK